MAYEKRNRDKGLNTREENEIISWTEQKRERMMKKERMKQMKRKENT